MARSLWHAASGWLGPEASEGLLPWHLRLRRMYARTRVHTAPAHVPPPSPQHHHPCTTGSRSALPARASTQGHAQRPLPHTAARVRVQGERAQCLVLPEGDTPPVPRALRDGMAAWHPCVAHGWDAEALARRARALCARLFPRLMARAGPGWVHGGDGGDGDDVLMMVVVPHGYHGALRAGKCMQLAGACRGWAGHIG